MWRNSWCHWSQRNLRYINTKEILVIAGSNASDSINQNLAQKIAKDPRVDYYDTRTLNVPYYNRDIENNEGFPKEIVEFYNLIHSYKKLIIVSPEYNGYFSSFFKSILDWLSRYERYYFDQVEIYIVAASTGKRAGASVREALTSMLSRSNAILLSDKGFGLYDINEDYTQEINEIISSFK